MSSLAILKIEDVTKAYAEHVALDRVSLEIPRGSIYGLLGPNGAGKTSLIRIINQITAPDSGSVWFNGEPLAPRHVEKIGYLPEERGLYKKMKVGEQALYFARLKGMSEKKAKKILVEWFERMEIQHWWDSKVEDLSKGMAQKVQFIITVLHDPELLIFDEPFSGFDPINANVVRDEILRLRDLGSTIIFSTHRMESVEELCDHIALINKSKTLLEGNLEEIRSNYRTGVFELAFTGKLPSSLPEGIELVAEKEGLATFKLDQPDSPNQLLNVLLPHAQISGFREVIPSVNDIFIESVQNA
jgi:ABC-2 type transport system ATP-binding protein